MKKHIAALLVAAFIQIIPLLTSAQSPDNKYKFRSTGEDNNSAGFFFVNFSGEGPPLRNHVSYVLKEVLHAPENCTLRFIRKETDPLGYIHYRYKQLIGGIEVEDSYLYVHTLNNHVTSVNGAFFPYYGTGKSVFIGEKQAQDVLLQNTPDFIDRYEQGKLVYLHDSTGLTPSWRFQTKPMQPGEPVSISYVHAIDGSYLGTISDQRNVAVTSQVNTQYNGSVNITSDGSGNGSYTLVDSTRGNGIEVRNLNGLSGISPSLPITDTSAAWLSAKSSGALDVMYALEKTYDYFLTVHGRNSIDNAGLFLNGLVNYGIPTYSYYTGNNFVFGHPTSNFYSNTSFDIVAHEYVHGIVAYSASFSISIEPAALSESFCDILSASAEHYTQPALSNFDIGEQCFSTHIPLRSMSHPGFYNHAHTYLGTNYGFDVYSRATVQDFWFYLLCMGGDGINDNNNAYFVEAIGMEKAARIAYRALTVYLGPSSGFAQSRSATIQSAIDLYGSCSTEEAAVTRAWYAVGVGAEYAAGVNAGAFCNVGSTCVGSSLNFTNKSLGAASYQWNFGDGSTSTAVNPVYTYLNPGDYSVQLIATGTTGCVTTDTFSFNIHVNPYNGLTPAICNPNRTGAGDSRGIYEVEINGYTHTSDGSVTENHMDFTCLDPFVAYENDNVSVRVLTGAQYPEYVTVYLDEDNDGIFSTSERKTSSSLTLTNKYLFIQNPSTPLNTPLRMRVFSSPSLPSTACDIYTAGQSEDHAIIFIAPDSIPEAGFYSDQQQVYQGSTVKFYNTSHRIQTCLWSFPGGTPAISSAVNPTVTYPSSGIYDVQLIVSNAFGSDTIILQNYITVESSFTMCNGSQSMSTELTGTLYDNGGPSGNMTHLTAPCDFIIQPECADSIFITFSYFNMGHNNNAYLSIFDSDNNGNSVLIYTGNGSTSPALLIATGGKVRVRLINYSWSYIPGFTLKWTTKTFSPTPVVANFYPQYYNPPVNSAVKMINTSTGPIQNHYWDFGDGSTSKNISPQHEYDTPGSYTIYYAAEGCVNNDSSIQSIVVQPPPQIQMNTDSLEFNISCGVPFNFPITIHNTGAGDLVFTHSATCDMRDTIRALIYASDIDTTTYLNQILTIGSQYASPFAYELFYGSDTTALRQSLKNKNLLLFPPIYTSYNVADYESFGPVLNDFMEGGGNIVVYFFSKYTVNDDNRMRDLGLMNAVQTGSWGTYTKTIDTLPPLGKDLGSFPVINNEQGALTHVMNKHKRNYLVNSNYDLLTNLKYGKGSCTMAAVAKPGGFSPAVLNFYNAVLRNTLLTGRYRSPSFLSADIASDTVPAGDSSTINYTILAEGVSGTYETAIEIMNNSSTDSIRTIHLTIHVSGSGNAGFDEPCSLIDSTVVNYTSTEPIPIHNTGCDSLIIYSTAFSTPYFTSGNDTTMVLTGGTGFLNVSFTPDSIGTFYDTLYLVTNVGVIKQCVYGCCQPAAEIAFSPAPHFTMTACSDSASGGFWLINSGGLDLQYAINNGSDSITRKVGIILYGVDTVHEYANIRNILQQSGLTIHLDTISSIADSVLRNFSRGKDIIIIPKQETGSYQQNQFSSWAGYYLSQGGVILALGTDIHDTHPGTQPYFDYLGNCVVPLVDTINFSSGPVMIPDTTDFFTRKVGSSFLAPPMTYPMRFDAYVETQATLYNKSVLAYTNCGGGSLIYLGFDYDQYNQETAQLLVNIVSNMRRESVGFGVSATPFEGNILPGDSMYINVNLHATYLEAGTYPFNLVVSTSSLNTTADSITAILEVPGYPCPDFYADMDSSCVGIVQFEDRSLNNPTSWLWDFGDGTTSTLQNPSHKYTQNGNKTVRLTVTNALGTDSTSQIVNTFDYSLYTLIHSGVMLTGYNISFSSLPIVTGSFINMLWDFGDGTVINIHPSSAYWTHVYLSSGTFVVSATFLNSYCGYTLYDTVTIGGVGAEEYSGIHQLSILPNPFADQSTVRFRLDKSSSVEIVLTDLTGRTVEIIQPSVKMNEGEHTLVLSPPHSGSYLLRFNINDVYFTRPLVKIE